MEITTKIIDGNEAAAYVAYAFTEVATIYPITPSSPMAELTDEWSSKGKKNIFGQQVRLVEMQSEAGAAGSMHGALETGALATSYTSSQGLMLMIPTMYRISGQRHPGVLHVASRTIGTHAFSIFGDHSDVMNCRQTGFAILSTGSVQEVMDLAGVAHLSAIKSRIPFLHFFDGFRTSHELQKVKYIDYDFFKNQVDYKALNEFRNNALNPEHPILRSTVQNPDVYFQIRESNNRFYDELPSVVEKYMNEINIVTNKSYKLFNYYGDKEAEYIIIAMGSVSGTIIETIDYLNKNGKKVGFVQVHLYRPFSAKHLLQSIPNSVKKIAVLDRVKEIGSIGEPLFQDICTVYINSNNPPKIYAGRYGLSSKDTTPNQIIAVYENLYNENPKNNFTIGIVDDVTNLSLKVNDELYIKNDEITNCKFWGLGSDGTVGANKNSIKIIGENTDMYTQAYFEYDTKKSFGITRSHLRFGNKPIISSYLVKKADFIACHNKSYIDRYEMVSEINKNGTFLLNCDLTGKELEEYLPRNVKKTIKKNNIKFFIIDANKISRKIGLGNRINIVLQAAFFKLSNIIPMEEAIIYMEEAIKKTYSKQGDKIVKMNIEAIYEGINGIKKIKIIENCKEEKEINKKNNKEDPEIIRNILIPINDLKGDELPVSTFIGMEDGTMPLGTSAYEKRGIATSLPVWDPDYCIQCNQCSLVCPHAVIRPYLLNKNEIEKSPNSFLSVKTNEDSPYNYSIQISSMDCTSCSNCVNSCPKKDKALRMKLVKNIDTDLTNWNYAQQISEKKDKINLNTVKGSQFKKPLLEFSGACAGCGETPYIKLLTQLYGDKMYIANATGCTQAWGAAMPSIPYTTTKEGRGPAWSNSLFENNAEFSLGMCLAVKQHREVVKALIESLKLLHEEKIKNDDLIDNINEWIDGFDDLNKSEESSEKLMGFLNNNNFDNGERELVEKIFLRKDYLKKKTMWMVGGDGWAYDIGYGGLDHVLALGEDVNVLIVDTEVYSNTGGQQSKSTQIGAVAKFVSSGKRSNKKDLGSLMMTYKNIYVAQVSMGANKNQLIKALNEAEKYKGPSLVIAYAPCIVHGIKSGMGDIQGEMRRAVESGYWNLYRYNPSNVGNEFILDSKEPTVKYSDFLRGELRFSSLEKTFPENAKGLFEKADKMAKIKFKEYRTLSRKNK